jgi:hypothetical protein
VKTKIRRTAAVAALATGLVVSLAGIANAGGIVTEDPCPSGYHGAVVGSSATGNVFACENVA